MITVISINYNNLKGLRRTVHSISEQSYCDFDHIVIDGGSKDGSIEFLNSIQRKGFSFLSEPDHGIYDALNKGVNLSTREYLLFVNSGDILYDKDILLNFHYLISSFPEIDGFYGNKLYGKFSGSKSKPELTRVWIPGTHKRWKYWYGWMIPHQSLLVKKSLFSINGLFDTSFKIAGDYDWLLRVFYVNKSTVIFNNFNVIIMEDGGVSNSSLRSVMQSNIEVLRSWKKYFFFVPIWILILKPLTKIKQIKFRMKAFFYKIKIMMLSVKKLMFFDSWK